MVFTGCYDGLPEDPFGAPYVGAETDAEGDTDSQDSGSSGGGSGQGSGTSGDGTSGGSGPGNSGGDPTGDAGSTGAEVEPTSLATGISVSSLEINQGVAITLVENGALVAEGQRNAAVVPDRGALVRGLWTLSGSYSPRTLVGRLVVETPSGEQEIFYDERDVSGPADETALDGGFLWDVPAEAIVPGASFAVEIAEVDPDIVNSQLDGEPRIPSEGTDSLGVASGAHDLEIVVVPLQYNTGAQVFQPDLSDEARTILENSLYDQNPVSKVSVTYHSVVAYPDPIRNGSELSNVLGYLSSLRSSENVGPQVYYVGLVDVGCFVAGCGNGGTTGVGFIPSDQQFSANQRVSISIWYQPSSSAGTVVHELGHNQGLNHVACPGAFSSGTDPSYPYQDGRLGTWGYGLRSGEVAGSTSYDYMSYCGPSWASDWTWNKTRSRITTLSEWSSQAPAQAPSVLGIEQADGTTQWFEIEANVTAGGSGETMTFLSGGSPVGEQPVIRGELSDIDGDWVLANLPAAALSADHFAWTAAGNTTLVDLQQDVTRVSAAGSLSLAP